MADFDLRARAVEFEEEEKAEGLGWEKLPTLAEVLASTPPPGERLPTGIGALDKCSRGGFALGRVYTFIGPPGRGKTALVAQIARRWARENGARVIGLFCDEGSWQAAVMMAEGLGFDRDRVENAYSEIRAEFEEVAKWLPIRLPNPEHRDTTLDSIEGWVAQSSPPGPLVIVADSIQRIRSAKDDPARTANAKERADAVMTALRGLAHRLNALVLATSKANRSSYAHKNPAENIVGIAAGLDSSSIEYDSDGLFYMEGDPSSVITLSVLKNRPGDGSTPRISLGFDRARATFAQIDGSVADEEAEYREDQRREARQTSIKKEILRLLRQKPDQTTRLIRTKVKGRAENVGAALDELESDEEIQSVRGSKGAKVWRIVE